MRKMTMSAFDGASVFLLRVMTSPAFEKTRSLATDVAGTHNMVCATELSMG